MNELITNHLNRTLAGIQNLLKNTDLLNTLDAASKQCATAIKADNKLMFAGNGGSAADAQHLAAELVCRYSYDRPAMAGIALTTDTSGITAIANDYDYSELFARQIQGLGRAGDVFVAISTSGNSENIIKAIHVAKEKDMTVIGLTGREGGKMRGLCDYLLCVPEQFTATIQECHIALGHILCDLLQQQVYGPTAE